MKSEKYFAWIAILGLGTIAVTLGSFPNLFRYFYVVCIILLLIMARIAPSLRKYRFVLDAFFVIVLIWYLPLLSIYGKFHSSGKELFFRIFGKNDLVKMVADNSISGLLWILLPIILVLLERDSLKSIFIKKGKKNGWLVGAFLLLILMAVGFFIAWRSDIHLKVYFSLLPLGLSFAVINAIKEEVLYRGLVFGRTLRFGFVFALLCQFLWFALIHILYSGAMGRNFGMFVGIGTFAVLSAWMTRKFGSLACAVLVHAGIDFIIFITSVPHYHS